MTGVQTCALPIFRDIWPTRASIAYRFSILLDCLFLDFFDQRDQIFFGAFLFVLLGISGMTVSPALSPGYKRQKPNPGNSHVVPRIPWSLVSLPSSLHYPLQYSGLENSMDCRVQGLAKSWT